MQWFNIQILLFTCLVYQLSQLRLQRGLFRGPKVVYNSVDHNLKLHIGQLPFFISLLASHSITEHCALVLFSHYLIYLIFQNESRKARIAQTYHQP